MIEIDVRTNLAQVQRDLTLWATKQVPFATALALTDIAKQVAKAEAEAMSSELDRPTGFSQRAMGVIPARKDKPYATVFVKDIQARYLEPSAFGGQQTLNTNKGIIKPVNIALNQFGNITRGTIGRLKGKRGYIVGPIKTKAGMVSGVWQRTPIAKGARKGKGTKAAGGRLRLLVRFGDPHDVQPRWQYDQHARDAVDRCWRAAFERAMAKALA